MKKILLTLLVVIAATTFLLAQQQKNNSLQSFSKKEFFGFSDVKSFISTVNKEKYSALNAVRSFNLTVISSATDANGNAISTTITEPAPDGVWTEKQKALINQYGKKGTVFNLDGIIMGTSGEPGTPYTPDTPFSVQSISFTFSE